jgi:exosome complex component RRP4
MDKWIVIPGDFLSDEVNKAGEGTYVREGKVYSNLYGMVNEKDKIRVVPLSGKYFPSTRDVIIATVSQITFSNWIMDIRSPYEGLLHISEYPKRIESGDMTKCLNVGDSALVMVKEVTPSMKVELTMKDNRLKPIISGRIVEISPTKVPRVIGRNGSMISLLKSETNSNIFVGQNGLIWITGRERDMNKAIETIRIIENEAHTEGLTDRISRFLKEDTKESKTVESSSDILDELLG